MSAPTPTLGLTSYRLNNNIKSILLLAAFPLLMLVLLGGIFFVFGAFMQSGGGAHGNDAFSTLGLRSVLGTGSAFDIAVSAIYAWWPIVFGVAAIWVLIGYLFNDAIIHAATGAKPVTRAEQPELYNLLENLCISRGLKMPRVGVWGMCRWMPHPFRNRDCTGEKPRGECRTWERCSILNLEKYALARPDGYGMCIMSPASCHWMKWRSVCGGKRRR